MSESVIFSSNVEIIDETDILVVGGGPAGVAAAIGAARENKKVILLEKSAQLGGMGTLAAVGIFMIVGNYTGIYKEIAEELIDKNASDGDPAKVKVHFNPFVLRYLLDRKVRNEGVKVYYHSDFLSIIDIQRNEKKVIIQTVQGIKAIKAKVIIDCTGSASVAVAAGAQYTIGREEDQMVQPMTLMFQMQDTGKKVNTPLPPDCYFYNDKTDLPQGRELFWELKPEGTLLVNMTRVKGYGLDMEELSHAESESLKQVFSVVNYLQRNGFENYILSHVAPQVGVRETRQIIGEYILSESDLQQGKRFDDRIAQSNYNVDIHSPIGDKQTEEYAVKTYDIPYRCLVPVGIDNILVAGRAISATHIAMSSARVMPTCYALGQAAGIAAAISIDNTINVSDINIKELHQKMKRQNIIF